MVGSTIGKYHVLDRIGRGGMGTVYRAVDETLHREVAIKVLNAELNDPEVARRFHAEAVTVARLSHPGIATIFELFQHDGQWMMVMEFVRGETLEHYVERMGALSPQRAAELCMQTLTALAHAHSMGVIHRDLKLANLMITESGAVKIMDFGIARVSGSEHLTSAGFMMGTPAYMAPEQVLGQEIDARADLYALGVVFYRLTTAKLPFKGDTPFAMAQSQVNDPPTPLGMVRSDLPAWADQIVARALAKSPLDRFQSAVEFYESFARCLAGLPMVTAYGAAAPTEMLHTPSRTPTGGHSMPPAYGSEAASRVTSSGRTELPTLPPTSPATFPPTVMSSAGIQPPAVPGAPAGPAGPTVPAAGPAGSAAPAAQPKRPTAAAARRSNTLSLVLGGVVVLLVGILIAMWLRGQRSPADATPAADASAAATPSPTDTPTPTPDAAAGTPAATPSSTTDVPAPSAAVTPAATPAPTAPRPPETAAAATPTRTPAPPPSGMPPPARGGEARSAGARAMTSPSPTATPTPTPEPAAEAARGRAAVPPPSPTPTPDEYPRIQRRQAADRQRP